MNEIEVKLTEVSSIVTAQEKELVDLKETMKNCEQVYYNMGFKDSENSVEAIIFQARRLGFLEGWMAAVDVVGVPEGSSFRDASQIPLPNDSSVETLVDEPFEGIEEEEEEDGLGMREFEETNANVVVIDEENLNNTIPTETQSAPSSIPSSVPLATTFAPETSTAAP